MFRPRWDKHAPAYDDNVEYRFVRRSVEHNHHSDAFVWDENEWWESDSVFSAGARPLSGVPLHKYKHEKFNLAYHDRLTQYQQEKKRLKEAKILENRSVTPSTPEHEKQIRVEKAAKQRAIEQYSPLLIEKPESRNAIVQVNGISTPSTPFVEGTCPIHVRSVVNHATQTNNGKAKQILNEGTFPHFDNSSYSTVVLFSLDIIKSKKNHYRPRVQEGNVFILSVCLSVQAIAFECHDIETSFLVSWDILTISRLSSSTKVIG